MALTAADVVSRARTSLIDPDGTRWSDAELFRWISDALRTILSIRPDIFCVFATVNLVAGTKQELPDPAYMLLNIFRNVGAGGAPGRAVRLISREALEGFNPDWHTDAQVSQVKHYIYDDNYLTTYFVYPPNDGTGKLDVSYSAMPDEVNEAGDVLPVPDNYLTAIVDYVLFRAFLKDSDNPSAPQVANTYFSAFSAFVGSTSQAQSAANVNLSLRPGDKPATTGGPQQ